ncbi:MAG: hypothetical protein ABIU05_20525 [Nitrospirales bacterium]
MLTRQFEVDSFYATEQEADVHGIAYGQRIIDGKVEDHSVVEMKRPIVVRRRDNGYSSAPRLRRRRPSKGRASCSTSRRVGAASRVLATYFSWLFFESQSLNACGWGRFLRRC